MKIEDKISLIFLTHFCNSNSKRNLKTKQADRMNILKRTGSLIAATLVTLSLPFVFISCEQDEKIVEKEVTRYEKVETLIDENFKTPKYVFFFIGDGMANVQINAAEAALNNADFKLKSVGIGSLNIQEFPITGFQTTHAEDRYITGSAASATALATGQKTTIGTISMKGDHTGDIKTMAEKAKEKGMKVGIISSVSIDHATPACFYAHATTRGHYNYIASQMATSNFDYFGGGYAKGNFDKYKDGTTPGKRFPEDFTPIDVDQVMKDAGYTIAKNKTELDGVAAGTKCWAYSDQYDGDAALPYEVDRADNDLSIADFTKKGIEVLDNDKGFFMMVEGGKIDWACHANDAVASTHDVIAFDEAIGHAIEFYKKHPDETLIVVTGDHETGGLSLGYSATGYETAFSFLNKQKMSYDDYTNNVVYKWDPATITFDDALASVKETFGLGDESITETSVQGNKFNLKLSEYDIKRLKDAFDRTLVDLKEEDTTNEAEYDYVTYGPYYYDPFTVTVTHILNQKSGIDWTTYSHTAVPVPVFAMGQGQYNFSGYYDNTDVAKKIIVIAGYDEKE